ncbi:sulfatase-like hydrolase/transferase [Glycomyces artemisiae]|uniref:Arylsulfatase A-like enzyme n=1 Tax=Glycomyces artemisiae TaxID=1076443 RepID=A0A2T0UHI7_9ACTN|nr:sulfatase-like hydrolase/transferase [Glycomyces artemisiae]PRY57326.1 arylsulfatase A-like enzyme [Glycomyces artemisiae]
MSNRTSRRAVLALGGAIAGTAALPAAAAAAAQDAERPNILWLVAEDHSPFLGAYGDDQAQTPTLDALAERGILYANAFSTYPVCAPTRFSIITGKAPESCGPAHHMRASGLRPDWLLGFPQYLREAGYYTSNSNKTDYNTDIDLAATWDANGPNASWTGREPGQPFFAIFNHMTTHESSLWSSEPTGVHDPADAELPEYTPDTVNTRADRAHYYDNITRVDAQVADRLAELEAAGLAEDTIVFYYSDNGGVLPRSKRYVYDSGLRTALIAVFPDKWAHLAPAEPGAVVADPVTTLDYAPTVLELAGLDVPGHFDGTSLLEARRRPEYAFGARNRMDARYDFVRTVRDGRYRYIRNYAPHRIYNQHVAYLFQQLGVLDWERLHLDGALDEVQERWWRPKPAEELYDLETDPDEVANLIDEPHLRRVRRRLAAALDEHLIAVHDNGFIPEGAAAEGYDQSRARGAFPIERVKTLADSAIQRKRSNTAKFTRALNDGNEVVRYWGVQGLLILAAADLLRRDDVEDDLQAVLGDAEEIPQVRIAAAETLARLGRGGEAVDYLAGVLGDADAPDPVRLQAVEALTCIPAEDAAAALDVLDAVAGPETGTYIGIAANYLRFVLRGEYAPTPEVQAAILGLA